MHEFKKLKKYTSFKKLKKLFAVLFLVIYERQTSWNNSIVKPNIGESQLVDQSIINEEVAFAQIPIGHTRVTHS